MTKANFTYQASIPIRFEISGHANYSRYGEDIVCSAISTAVFTTLNLLENVLSKDTFKIIQDEKKGIINCELIQPNEFAIKIVDNLYQVLTMIASDYPNNLKVMKY